MPNRNEDFDFKNPDYDAVLGKRIKRLDWIRENPDEVANLKGYYRQFPAQFVNDWGMTYDPRNIEIGRSPVMPFVLFPKQWDWCDWMMDRWKAREPGGSDKSRDMGVSWLAIGMSCALCLFYEGMAIGFGSRKQEYVDLAGEPKSLFFKARFFLQNIPREFRGGWDGARHAPSMRIIFPESGSIMSGESGNSIGRGGRTALYIVDEAHHLEQPKKTEASLSQTTNCRIDISSANGASGPFYDKRTKWLGTPRWMTLHWRDDPRKGQEWYEKQRDLLDPIVLAQEVDIDYFAMQEGMLIPSAWVQASIDADKVLGFEPNGERLGSYDVGEARDPNAFIGRHGVVIEHAEEFTGKNSDIYASTLKICEIADGYGYRKVRFDFDGIGSAVKGDARRINEQRKENNLHAIDFEPFRGSWDVFDPNKESIIPGRTNIDTFVNLKAQGWWSLRTRFQKTFRAVTEHREYPFDQLIAIRGSMPNRQKLVNELAQITYKTRDDGKFVILKQPDGTRSPNMGDGTMMNFCPTRHRMVVSQKVLDRMANRTRVPGHFAAMQQRAMARTQQRRP